MTDWAELPPELFARCDESSDSLFYSVARIVTHIDDATIECLRRFYAETLPRDADVLDLMSSWVSHLPEEERYGRVAGLGMNAEELATNPRLTDWVVHDLNRQPELPYEDGSFDAVVNAVSIQYLVRPIDVFRSIARVLRPGGQSVVAMSHRCFPTKAIRAFHVLPGHERLELAARYHQLAGGFANIQKLNRSPSGVDPLWIVTAQRGP